MRPTKQAHILRTIISGVLLCAMLLPAGISPVYAAKRSASKGQLTQRRANIQQKIGEVQHELLLVKRREKLTRQQLFSVRTRVRAARGQLHVATQRLAVVQADLKHANIALGMAKQEYIGSREKSGKRLVAVYEQGSVGDIEFLVNSQNFGDLIERMQLANYLRDQDQQLLEDLKGHKETLAQRQRLVKSKTQEVAVWRNQVSVLNKRTEAEHYVVTKNLSKVREERELMEAEYAALMRESANITAMIRRMQQTPAGRKRYQRVYAGAVGGLPTNGRITSTFGYRVHPISHVRRMHTGVDIAAPIGSRVTASGGGEVIYAGWRGGYGNTVMIDHGHGKTTLYGHMSAILVHSGQVVSRGQQVGRVGSTGYSTGPHLHYEVRINGSPVSPF